MQVQVFPHIKRAGGAGLRLRALGVDRVWGNIEMCSGIEFDDRRVLWSDSAPLLPVMLKDGSITWQPWGKSYKIADCSQPAGGWARLESIQLGKWKKYHPVPVKIPARAFMEKDSNGNQVWFEVPPGHFIQGAALPAKQDVMSADQGDTRWRVYVVTVAATGEVAEVHDRMPRLIEQQ